MFIGDYYFDQYSTSESESPLLSRLDVQSKLKPSSSGQSTDSGIVADNDQVKNYLDCNLNEINLLTLVKTPVKEPMKCLLIANFYYYKNFMIK